MGVTLYGLCPGCNNRFYSAGAPKFCGKCGTPVLTNCPKCKTPITFYDNVPLLSFLFLRGRCRSCREPISPRYLFVELLMALLALALYHWFGVSFSFLVCFIFAAALIVISFIDLDVRIVPDVISSDLHGRLSQPGFGIVGDLPTTLTKFLPLGLSLEQIIASCTVEAARVVGWQDRIGSLEVGREADIAVLQLVNEPTKLRDSVGGEKTHAQRIAAKWTVRAGEVFAGRD